jgi:hypothetical protein
MENLEDREHHGAEEVIYESDEVHVVLDTFAGETQVPDSLSAADVETVAVAESEVDVAHALMLLAKTEVNTVSSRQGGTVRGKFDDSSAGSLLVQRGRRGCQGCSD